MASVSRLQYAGKRAQPGNLGGIRYGTGGKLCECRCRRSAICDTLKIVIAESLG